MYPFTERPSGLSLSHGRPEQVSGGDLRQPVTLLNLPRLRAFSGSRRAQQNYDQNLLRDTRVNPS